MHSRETGYGLRSLPNVRQPDVSGTPHTISLQAVEHRTVEFYESDRAYVYTLHRVAQSIRFGANSTIETRIWSGSNSDPASNLLQAVSLKMEWLSRFH